MREATQHLREEALRRYRLNHAGDDPPEDWEPPQDEQEDIIRCLSPPGEVDPELKRAQESGAFSNLGTPRPTPTKLHDSEVQEHQYPAKESLIEAEAKIKEESADDGNSRVSSVASDVLVLEAEIAETYTDLHTDTPMTSSVIPQSAQSHSLTLTSVNPDGSTVNVLKLDPPSRLNTQETERGSDYHTMLPDAMRGTYLYRHTKHIDHLPTTYSFIAVYPSTLSMLFPKHLSSTQNDFLYSHTPLYFRCDLLYYLFPLIFFAI